MFTAPVPEVNVSEPQHWLNVNGTSIPSEVACCSRSAMYCTSAADLPVYSFSIWYRITSPPLVIWCGAMIASICENHCSAADRYGWVSLR